MTVLKRIIPTLAVTGALAVPMQAMAGEVTSEIHDIERTARTMVLDGGQLYRVPPQVAIFDQLEEGDRIHVWFDEDGQGQGVPRVTRISRAKETSAAADGQQASMSGTAGAAGAQDSWGDMAGGADATVDDVERTARTVLMDSGKMYRVPAQVANFENIEEGDKVRFWSKAEQGAGTEIITRIVRVQDDGMPMREDYDAAMGQGYEGQTAGASASAEASAGESGGQAAMTGGNVATVSDLGKTAGTLVVDDGTVYRVPPQVANFDKLEEGDKIRFWSKAEQGEGTQQITRLVRLNDDGTPMDEDLAELGTDVNVERGNEGRK